ncbi:MAG TPA: hypothetical protein VFR59_12415 [Steroidobacteraceae bacterium]|nr:hypothetical protein [Steroidobacteraceae bacterium]
MSGFVGLRRCAAVMLGSCAIVLSGSASAGWPAPAPFEVASIVVERNATDGDTEIVIEALAGDDGLVYLSIRTPHGRPVVLLASPDHTVMGLREFSFESPEPEGDAILASYPQGWYTFTGISVTGEKFRSRARLSHQMPEPTVILNPAPDASVGTGELTIQWSAVPGVAQYLVEFENESADPEQSLTVNVPASVTSFAVPPALLVPGADYQVGIATIARNGNVTFVESQFSTSED